MKNLDINTPRTFTLRHRKCYCNYFGEVKRTPDIARSDEIIKVNTSIEKLASAMEIDPKNLKSLLERHDRNEEQVRLILWKELLNIDKTTATTSEQCIKAFVAIKLAKQKEEILV